MVCVPAWLTSQPKRAGKPGGYGLKGDSSDRPPRSSKTTYNNRKSSFNSQGPRPDKPGRGRSMSNPRIPNRQPRRDDRERSFKEGVTNYSQAQHLSSKPSSRTRQPWKDRAAQGAVAGAYGARAGSDRSDVPTQEERERRMLDEAMAAEDGFTRNASEVEDPLLAVEDIFEPLEQSVLAASDVDIVPVKPPREAPVARLSNRLQRVLFSPGVHHMRDPRTGVFNFDQALEHIPTPEEFAFHRLPQYITASQDPELTGMATTNQTRYTGSTSTLTQSLSQIYFTLSNAKAVDTSTLSAEFQEQRPDFTAGAQLPALINVRLQENGTYAIDNDKTHGIDNNVLSDYGRILEKMLTADANDFKRFLNSAPESAVPDSERTEREAYAYSKSGKLLMRSQLDCQDSRLPGSGTFDIKTRACFPIRQDRANWEKNAAYTIYKQHGYQESFEREYYDLSRSGMLKYCFQARIGQMDGIFVAYHNTRTFFGFQYLSLAEIDRVLFGSTEMADQVFQLCVGLMEKLLDQATQLFPNESVQMSLRRQSTQRPGNTHELIAVVQPVGGEARPKRALSLRVQNLLDGKPVMTDNITFSDNAQVRQQQQWSVKYTIAISPEHFDGQEAVQTEWNTVVGLLTSMNHLYAPEGKTPKDMYREEGALLAESATLKTEGNEDTSLFGSDIDDAPRTKWRIPTKRIAAIRAMAQLSGRQAAIRQITWPQSRMGDSWSPEPKGLSEEEQAAWDAQVATDLRDLRRKQHTEMVDASVIRRAVVEERSGKKAPHQEGKKAAQLEAKKAAQLEARKAAQLEASKALHLEEGQDGGRRAGKSNDRRGDSAVEAENHSDSEAAAVIPAPWPKL